MLFVLCQTLCPTLYCCSPHEFQREVRVAPKPWKRWIIRGVLGIAAIPFLALLALSVWNPNGGLLLVVFIYALLVSNSQPPAIANGLVGPEDWAHPDVASSKLTGAMTQQFPVGASEEAVKFALRRQGFRPPAPAPLNCVSQEQAIAKGGVICPRYDQNKTFEYHWGYSPCGNTIRAEWQTDGGGKITQVRGVYYGVCL